MRIIIFSKNRAAQAELLLRSIKEQVPSWEELFITVFYCADDHDFEQGYSLTQKIHPEFHYCREDNATPLKKQVYDLLSMEKKRFFSFFVDDLVAIRPFDTSDKQFQMLFHNRPGDIMALSLRLNPNITYCQPMGINTQPCKVDPSGTFVYKRNALGCLLERNALILYLRKSGLDIFRSIAHGDWAIQMNVDGNVFRFDEFKDYFPGVDEFSRIPEIELAMYKKPLPGRKIIIYPESRIINIASNRVRGGTKFPCKGEDPVSINRRFLNNERLEYGHLKSMNNTSCHIMENLKFR